MTTVGIEMSKQSEAKKDQNYRKTPDTCGNCARYTSDWIPSEWDPLYEIEKNKRYDPGGFAVGKSATCDKHLSA